jgi:hypothetical protein
MWAWWAAALAVSLSTTVCRADVFVDAGVGVDGGTCGDSTAPCLTIAAGVAVANALGGGAVVRVAAGVYSVTSCGASITASMSVWGAGAGVTVLDCEYAARAFSVRHCDARAVPVFTRGRACARVCCALLKRDVSRRLKTCTT